MTSAYHQPRTLWTPGPQAPGPQYASPPASRQAQSAFLYGTGNSFAMGNPTLHTVSYQTPRTMPNDLRHPWRQYQPQAGNFSSGRQGLMQRATGGNDAVVRSNQPVYHSSRASQQATQDSQTYPYPSRIEIDGEDDDGEEDDDEDEGDDIDDADNGEGEIRYPPAPSPPPTNRYVPPNTSQSRSVPGYHLSQASRQSIRSLEMNGRWPPEPARQHH